MPGHFPESKSRLSERSEVKGEGKGQERATGHWGGVNVWEKRKIIMQIAIEDEEGLIYLSNAHWKQLILEI